MNKKVNYTFFPSLRLSRLTFFQLSKIFNYCFGEEVYRWLSCCPKTFKAGGVLWKGGFREWVRWCGNYPVQLASLKAEAAETFCWGCSREKERQRHCSAAQHCQDTRFNMRLVILHVTFRVWGHTSKEYLYMEVSRQSKHFNHLWFQSKEVQSS